MVVFGNGGTGKTQLAAAAFRGTSRRIKTAVWVSATSRAAIVEAYADAYRRAADNPVQGRSVESEATAFLSWLASTRTRWLVVLCVLK